MEISPEKLNAFLNQSSKVNTVKKPGKVQIKKDLVDNEPEPADQVSSTQPVSSIVTNRSVDNRNTPSVDSTNQIAPSNYSSISDLPSNCVDYNIQTLHIRKLSVQDLFLLYEGEQTDSIRTIVRAVTNTLFNFNAEDLTEGDFWYVLMWQRLNSYKRTPFVVKWYCESDDHLDKVNEDELDVKTLYNEEIIQKNKIQELVVSVEDYTNTLKYMWETYGVHFQLPKMRNIIEREEINSNASESEPISRLEILKNRLALYIGDTHGLSLSEKKDFLSSIEDPDFISDLELAIPTVEHGVSESYMSTCKECGASQEITVSLDARRFLPYSF